MEGQDHPTGTMPPYQPADAAAHQGDTAARSEDRTAAEYAARTGRHEWTTPPPNAAQPSYAAEPSYAAQPPRPTQPPYAGQPPGATPPYPPQQGGEPERPKWSTRKTTAVTVVAAAAVLAIGGVAVAHSGSDSGSGTSQGPGGGQGGPGGFPGGGAMPGGAGLAGALHGTFVTGSNGSYVTRLMQTGEVTAVSSSTLTVKSTDGYTKTYTLSSATTVNGGQSQLSAVQSGHTVTVVASEAGAATTVTDQSLATTGQNGQGGFPGGAPGGSTGQGSTGQGSTGQGSTGQGSTGSTT